MAVFGGKFFIRNSVFLCLIGCTLAEPSLLASKDEDCGTVSKEDCFENLQIFLRIRSLPFTSFSEQLQNLCKTALDGYKCSTLLYSNKKCLSPEDRDMLTGFIKMAEYSYFMLCEEKTEDNGARGYLKDAFLANSACILEHQAAMDCCARETAIPDLPVLRLIEDSSKSVTERQRSTCCPVTRYLQCVQQYAELSCGPAAANFTVEYIRRGAGEIVQGACQDVPHYPDPDPSSCPGEVPLCSGCVMNTIQIGTLAVAIVLFLSCGFLSR